MVVRVFAIAALILLACAAARADDDIRPFDESADAEAELSAAIARAEDGERRVMIILGANWCHDSRGLAAHLASDAMQPVLDAHYEVVWVDVGQRERHQDIPVRYGVPTLYGTPTVLVVDPELGLVNRASVHDWTNAYSRRTEEAVEYFTTFATIRPGSGGVVENTETYRDLMDDIDAWEAIEGARLMRAYREIEAMRSEMAPLFERAGNDDDATDAVEAFHSFENDMERHRRRMRNDADRLRSDARDDARSALIAFADGEALDRDIAAAWDATDPEIALDLPRYEPLGPWEEDGE